jgi:hypothetical protein
MWELLKNKNNPPKIEKTEIIKKEEKVEIKTETNDDAYVLEALRKAKEMNSKKITTEKINFAGTSYE